MKTTEEKAAETVTVDKVKERLVAEGVVASVDALEIATAEQVWDLGAKLKDVTDKTKAYLSKMVCLIFTFNRIY